MSLAARWARRLMRVLRWGSTALAIGAIALAVSSYFAVCIDFGTEAYWLDPNGRLVFHFPFEWAENEYSQDGRPFPIDTDSLFGVIKYWLPGEVHATWRPDGSYERRGLSDGWWGNWLDPLDTSTDGEYSETGARPIPVTFFVYATVIPAGLLWCPWRWFGRGRGGCRGCGYSLEGLPGRGGEVRCPECGRGARVAAPVRAA